MPGANGVNMLQGKSIEVVVSRCRGLPVRNVTGSCDLLLMCGGPTYPHNSTNTYKYVQSSSLEVSDRIIYQILLGWFQTLGMYL